MNKSIPKLRLFEMLKNIISFPYMLGESCLLQYMCHLLHIHEYTYMFADTKRMSGKLFNLSLYNWQDSTFVLQQ